MDGGIFRQEAVDAKRRFKFGTISMVAPPSLKWVTLFFVGCGLAAVLILVCGSYTQRKTALGELIPQGGVATIKARAPGIVSDVFVEEGELVLSGQPLAVLNMSRIATNYGDTSQALEGSLISRDAQLVAAEHSSKKIIDTKRSILEEGLITLKSNLISLERELNIRRSLHAVARENALRLETLLSKHFVGEAEVAKHRVEVLQLEGEISSLERQLSDARSSLTVTTKELQILHYEDELLSASIARQRSELKEDQLRNAENGSLSVIANQRGHVAARLVSPGQTVEAGQSLLVILPENSLLEAHVYVPSESFGQIVAGDRVILRYKAFPHAKFGHYEGHVQRISAAAMTSKQLDLNTTTDQAEAFFRVIVTIEDQDVTYYGNRIPLQAGLTFEADIIGKKRALWEWLLEPIYALRGRFGT